MEARALNYLSLARKAGKAELGEEPVGDMARTGKAYLIMVAPMPPTIPGAEQRPTPPEQSSSASACPSPRRSWAWPWAEPAWPLRR